MLRAHDLQVMLTSHDQEETDGLPERRCPQVSGKHVVRGYWQLLCQLAESVDERRPGIVRRVRRGWLVCEGNQLFTSQINVLDVPSWNRDAALWRGIGDLELRAVHQETPPGHGFGPRTCYR
jgi:hypothetical protein